MPYPAKTDSGAILKTAMEMLARDGLAGLSLRALAEALDLAPNALYRYFADRAALEAALAAEVARRLHGHLRQAAGKRAPEAALRSMATAYLKFAQVEPRLYEAMMTACDPGADAEEDRKAHHALWAFVVELVGRLTGEAKAAEAAVALWALLHGIAGLEAAGVLDQTGPQSKPRSSIAFGLDAWFVAAHAAWKAEFADLPD